MATTAEHSIAAHPKFEPVIGLEVHVHLLTATKIFCSCSTRFGAPPNSNVCPVCLGMPGALPVLNKKAVEFATLAAMALNCRINETSIFARKNYFYPDLPKGYQISQYDKPLAEFGSIEVTAEGGKKKIGITRVHMEEDAGKSLHEGFPDSDEKTAIDLNRTGVPLIEIVSEPDISTPDEAYEYLTRLKEIILYTGVSDCNMEEGSLRCDANVSVRPRGQKEFGTKTEIKNVNSFRFIREALEYEIGRQIDVIESGGKIMQETRLYNANEGTAGPARGDPAHRGRLRPDTSRTLRPAYPRHRHHRLRRADQRQPRAHPAPPPRARAGLRPRALARPRSGGPPARPRARRRPARRSRPGRRPAPARYDPGGAVKPTRISTLVIIAVVCAAAGWVLLRAVYAKLPPLPWTGVPALLIAAVAEAWTGRDLRARIAGPAPEHARQRPGSTPGPQAARAAVRVADGGAGQGQLGGGGHHRRVRGGLRLLPGRLADRQRAARGRAHRGVHVRRRRPARLRRAVPGELLPGPRGSRRTRTGPLNPGRIGADGRPAAPVGSMA